METSTTNSIKSLTFDDLVFEEGKIHYSISEVAALLNINESAIRFWEKDFPFIIPSKSKKGTRYYTKREIKKIRLVVYLLKERKLTIDGAKKLLKDDKKIDKTHAIVMTLEHIRDEIASLRAAFDKHLNIETSNEKNAEEDV